MNLSFLQSLKEKYCDNNKLDIFLLTFVVLLFVFRTAIPFFKYPFLVFYSSFIVYAQIKYKQKIKLTVTDFIRSYRIIIILVIIMLLSFLFSNKLYLIIFKDLFNIFILLTFLYLYYIVFTTKKQFNFFVSILIKLCIFFAFIISIITLFGDSFFVKFSNENTPSIDYNFALIPVFFGLISVLFSQTKTKTLSGKIIYNLLLLLFTINILLSSSRRGLIVLLIIILTTIFAQIITLVKKKNILIKLSIVSKYYISSLFLLHLLFYLFIFHTSSVFQNNSLKILGVENVFLAKQKITEKIFRYISIVDRKLSYKELLDHMWSHEFTKDPISGWGNKIHKIVYPLKGKNVQIVPKGSKGYLMDSTCNADVWSNTAHSFTRVYSVKINKNEKIKASVYCYVSDKFNGNVVKLVSEGVVLKNSNRTKGYDLKRKEEWQELVIEPDCKEGYVFIYLYFSQYGVTDFSSLKGYVIFAYPQYKVIKNDSLQSYFNPDKVKIQKKAFQNRITKQNLAKIKFDSSQINSYKLKTTNKSLNKSVQNLSLYSAARNTKYYQSGIFHFSLPKLSLTDSMQIDPDPIRNWVAKLVSEDTTYHAYTANIVTDSISDNFIDLRTVRWQFAWQIFTKEYNWKKKIFGGGFDHLNWYGYYFSGDKTRSDYPHNPFLSVLLYSGVLGLILYLYLMYRVFFIYIKYIKEYYILFMFFCVTFFFSFFSAGNPFDPPVMGFFVMLPFFIDYIHKKDKSN